MIKIEIYTDGSCNQKTKSGGWAYILLENDKTKIERSEPELNTTNNKCEMLAVINAFHDIEKIEFCDEIAITIYSDSAYVVNAFADDWIGTWMKNGWLTSERKPVLNKELWKKLIYFTKKYKSNLMHIPRCSNEHAIKVDGMAKRPLLNKFD